MSRIRVNFLHHWAANNSNIYQIDDRMLAKSTDGFANTWSGSYFQVICFVSMIQKDVIKYKSASHFAKNMALIQLRASWARLVELTQLPSSRPSRIFFVKILTCSY